MSKKKKAVKNKGRKKKPVLYMNNSWENSVRYKLAKLAHENPDLTIMDVLLF